MSEYQYYEFQVIDRPMTAEEQAYANSLSSRADVSAWHASYVYHYGSFRAEPIALLTKQFDMFLYVANWGSKRLAFRLPRTAVDYGHFRSYYMLEGISITTTDDYVVVDISINEEEGLGWIDGEGNLDRLLPLREDLLRGDVRVLYLAWLAAAPHADLWDEDFSDQDDDEEADPDDSLLEPPVPPGLAQLSGPLQAFVEFFDIDPDLVAAAAEQSPPFQAPDDRWEEWVTRLPDVERNEFLVRVARGEPGVALTLARRLRELGQGKKTDQPAEGAPRRTYSALLATAQRYREQREARKRAEAEQARRQRLEALARREPEAWTQVKTLIDRKTAKSYDEAVGLLVELRNLADYGGHRSRFDDQFKTILAEVARRPAMLSRIEQAGLV
jgi:hypothetical protein